MFLIQMQEMGTGRRSAERAERTRGMEAVQIVTWTHRIAESTSYFDSDDIRGQKMSTSAA